MNIPLGFTVIILFGNTAGQSKHFKIIGDGNVYGPAYLKIYQCVQIGFQGVGSPL